MEMAVKQALTYGCVYVDGVLQCIYQMLGRGEERRGEEEKGGQPIDLSRYEELVKSQW